MKRTETANNLYEMLILTACWPPLCLSSYVVAIQLLRKNITHLIIKIKIFCFHIRSVTLSKASLIININAIGTFWS